ncbi:MAG: hypothetical protein WDZ80_06560, partial [Candidatus Paceibacterota bacterium]
MQPEKKPSGAQTSFELNTVLETSRLLVESRNPAFIINNLLLILMGRFLIPKAAIFIHDTVSGNYILKEAKGLPLLNAGDAYSIVSDDNLKNNSYFKLKSVSDAFPAISANPDKSYFFNLRTSNNHHGFLL